MSKKQKSAKKLSVAALREAGAKSMPTIKPTMRGMPTINPSFQALKKIG